MLVEGTAVMQRWPVPVLSCAFMKKMLAPKCGLAEDAPHSPLLGEQAGKGKHGGTGRILNRIA